MKLKIMLVAAIVCSVANVTNGAVSSFEKVTDNPTKEEKTVVPEKSEKSGHMDYSYGTEKSGLEQGVHPTGTQQLPSENKGETKTKPEPAGKSTQNPVGPPTNTW